MAVPPRSTPATIGELMVETSGYQHPVKHRVTAENTARSNDPRRMNRDFVCAPVFARENAVNHERLVVSGFAGVDLHQGIAPQQSAWLRHFAQPQRIARAISPWILGIDVPDPVQPSVRMPQQLRTC